jgi:hypothetical protein
MQIKVRLIPSSPRGGQNSFPFLAHPKMPRFSRTIQLPSHRVWVGKCQRPPHSTMHRFRTQPSASESPRPQFRNNRLLLGLDCLFESVVRRSGHDCVTLQTESDIFISEQTTAAAAFAVAPFANMATTLTGSYKDGISSKNASMPAVLASFQAANNLVSTFTNSFAITDTTVQETLNTIADVLDECIDTDGSTSSGSGCGNLYSDTDFYFQPADTYQAALSMSLCWRCCLQTNRTRHASPQSRRRHRQGSTERVEETTTPDAKRAFAIWEILVRSSMGWEMRCIFPRFQEKTIMGILSNLHLLTLL